MADSLDRCAEMLPHSGLPEACRIIRPDFYNVNTEARISDSFVNYRVMLMTVIWFEQILVRWTNQEIMNVCERDSLTSESKTWARTPSSFKGAGTPELSEKAERPDWSSAGDDSTVLLTHGRLVTQRGDSLHKGPK
jgi:hypothetical protein